MELRHLRYFQAVGREEHFGRGAAQLHVAQPALSRQVRDLEQELGVELFDRLPRGVKLSTAGRMFLEDTDFILSHVDRAISRIKGYVKGHLGTLNVGFSEVASGHQSLPRLLREFRDQLPDVELHLQPMRSVLQIDALRNAQIDVAFVYDVHCEQQNIDDFEWVDLSRVEMVLALPDTHPLARKDEIFVDDLRTEPFLWHTREVSPGYSDRLMRAIVDRGFWPNIVQYTPTHSILLGFVSAGLGVGFLTSSIRLEQAQGVVLRRVSDFNVSFMLQLIWRKGNRSGALQRLIDILRNGLAQTDAANDEAECRAAE